MCSNWCSICSNENANVLETQSKQTKNDNEQKK